MSISPAAEPPGPDAPLLVFNSYSRKDQKSLELLQSHLVPLDREGVIQLWVDKGKIESGDLYNEEIAHAIDTCGAAILLVSPHFHSSSFIQEKELPRLLRRATAGEIKLFWLKVSDCLLADTLAATYHCANNSSQSLDAMSDSSVNTVLANLARDLKKHALQIKTTRHAAARAAEERQAREAAEEKKRAEKQAALRAEEERQAREIAAKKQRADQEAALRAEKERQARALAEEKQRARQEAALGKQDKSSAKGKTSPRKGRAFLWTLGALLVLGLVITQAKKWMAQATLPTDTDNQLAELVEAAKELKAAENKAAIQKAAHDQAAADKAAEISAAKVEEAAKADVPKPVDKAFTNSLGMTFIPVPGTDVLFCEHETRVRDYAAYAAANPGVDLEWKDYEYEGHKQTADHPVVNVSWEDAKAFCEWLNQSQKDGRTYRLPTDHEWSVAAGIGAQEDAQASPEAKDIKIAGYPWGSAWPPPAGYGNFAGSESTFSSKIEGYTDQHPFTAPVKSYQATNGLFDLSGNVFEWCEDWYSSEQDYRVLRGGSWVSFEELFLRSSYRSGGLPSYRSDFIGFRCVVLSAR